jgi:hypothetical protein
LDERRCGRVPVAAAVKLYVVSIAFSTGRLDDGILAENYVPRGDEPQWRQGTGSTYPLLEQTLDERRFATPECAQVLACLQRFGPDGQTQAECENGTTDDHVALCTEPATVSWEEQCREREQECDEDEDCVHYAGCS